MRRADPLDSPYEDFDQGYEESNLKRGYIRHGNLNKDVPEYPLDFGYPNEGNDSLQIINNRSKARRETGS